MGPFVAPLGEDERSGRGNKGGLFATLREYRLPPYYSWKTLPRHGGTHSSYYCSTTVRSCFALCTDLLTVAEDCGRTDWFGRSHPALSDK